MARLGAVRPRLVVLGPLFEIIKASYPRASLPPIERAYRTAEQLHRGQKHKSGDPYTTHPLAAIAILAELGMTKPALVATLLHDTVEDTEYTLKQPREEFTDGVTQMVNGAMKLDKVTYGEAAKAETIRKVIMATSEEVRVLAIKLVDRLHNMQTTGFLRPDRQARIAMETLSILASLAHRSDTNTVKWGLEDLSLQTIGPRVYSEIADLVAQQIPGWEHYLRNLIAQFKQLMTDNKIRVTTYSRPRYFYSIYQRMMVRGRDFADTYDLIGSRILVDNVRDCYDVFGVAYSRWKPIPGRFEDYIADLKFNMYQSLHTTALEDWGEPVELQIHTHEIHRRVKCDAAAHWKHKENLRNRVTSEEVGLRAMYQLGAISKETEDPAEFPDSVLFEINSDEACVFIPKGEVNTLPVGATPADFVSLVHTEVGYCCIGARVNGRLVALSVKLIQGGKMEILTLRPPNAGPSRDWLGFVAASRARQKIKQHFSRERRDEVIEDGKEMLARQFRRTGLSMQRLLTLKNLIIVASELRHADVPSFYKVTGEGQIGIRSVVTHLIKLVGDEDEVVNTTTRDERVRNSRRCPRATTEPRTLVNGDPVMVMKLARCCHPIPGDEITGSVTRTDGASVHRIDCTNVPAPQGTPERPVRVTWDKAEDGQFPITTQVEGIDRSGLLVGVSRVISGLYVGILEATLTSGRNEKLSGRFTFESPDPKHLNHVLEQVRQVPGVYNAFHASS